MCGLFGWFNPEFPEGVSPLKVLKQLARKAQDRGDKSFGMTVISGPDKTKTYKYVGPASQWLLQNRKELKKYAKSTVIIGHTRMPSHGSTSLANTHPFQIGNYWIAHNGTISNASTLMTKSAFVAKGETDSEEMACYIADKEFTVQAFEDLTGSYAITALKVDGKELLIAVDRNQPFHYLKLGEGLIWTSSKEALESTLRACDLKGEIKVVEKEILIIPEWKTKSLFPKFRNGSTTRHNTDHTTHQYDGYQYTTGGGGGGKTNGGTGTGHGGSTDTSPSTHKKYFNVGGQIISEHEWKTMQGFWEKD